MRSKQNLEYNFEQTISALKGNGLFLVTGTQGNPMTIGWGTLGIIWGKPIFSVLVRPSRYSFKLIESLGEFTINVPVKDHKKELLFCGTNSGRDVDKIKECGFTLQRSKHISVPYIDDCLFHYECRVVHKNDVIHTNLNMDITHGYYPEGDYHSIYHGEVLGVFSA